MTLSQANEWRRKRSAHAQQQPTLSVGDDVTKWRLQRGPASAALHSAEPGRGARRTQADAAENLTYDGRR